MPTPSVTTVISNLALTKSCFYIIIPHHEIDPALFEITNDKKHLLFHGNPFFAKKFPTLQAVLYIIKDCDEQK